MDVYLSENLSEYKLTGLKYTRNFISYGLSTSYDIKLGYPGATNVYTTKYAFD